MEIYGYPPYTNHTEAKRQYGVVFTVVIFFQKMSTVTAINFFNIVAIIFKKSIHKLEPFAVLFSIGWLMQGNDLPFIDINNVRPAV